MREQSPVPRTFYCHLTNVTVRLFTCSFVERCFIFAQDMKATKYILGSSECY